MRPEKTMLGILVFMILILGSYAHAEDSEFYIKEGVYIGGSLVHNSIGSDFDGNSGYYYPAGNQFSVVPSVDSGLGVGFFIGYRLERWAFELSYQRVEHDTTNVLTQSQKSDYNVIDLNIKIDILPQGRFRPHVIVGFGAPWFNVDNVRSDDYGVTWCDSTFTGYTVNGGLGFSYYFNPKWFLTAGAVYRWQHFRDLDGLHASVDAMGSGMNYAIGIGYTF